jgi:2-dehydro-3-deoxygluconokinase
MILCFGEILLRFVPQLEQKWIEQATIKTYVGGAELNTAFALAKWGQKVAYSTAVPDHYLAQELIEYLEKNDIDPHRIIKKEGRIGTYYLPEGSDVKNSGVIYDRNFSSFANLTLDDFDYEKMLDGIHWLHVSAICPAINASAARICLELLQRAKKRGITTSIDFNFRSKLWQWGAKPTEIMPELTKNCDVLMGNLWAMQSLLGIDTYLSNNDETDREVLLDAAQKSMLAINQQFPNVQTLAYTFRFERAYYAVLQQGGAFVFSENYPIRHIVDKVGSGDTFMAALILGLNKGWSAQDIIELCAKAAVRKLGEHGDHTNTAIGDI